MIRPLPPDRFDAARPLFEGLDWNLSIPSTLDGHIPGSVWVDDLAKPGVALIQTVECWALGGDPGDAKGLAEWVRFMREELLPSGEADELDLRLSPAWAGQIEALTLGLDRALIRWPRRHYRCTQPAMPDWAAHLPPGIVMRPIAPALINKGDRDEISVPGHVLRWIDHNWGSREGYYARGFGVCLLDEATRAVVSWSLADCIHADRCEIGIHTLPDYRRRGLATLTTSAALEVAAARGYGEVGWHCDEANAGSIGTALKAGFTLERPYHAVVIMADAGVHQTVMAYRALLDGDPSASDAAYRRALDLGTDYPWWVHMTHARACAMLKDYDAAFESLGRAAAAGLTRSALDDAEILAPLRDMPGWSRLVEGLAD